MGVYGSRNYRLCLRVMLIKVDLTINIARQGSPRSDIIKLDLLYSLDGRLGDDD
jgi:hypothetical protein